MKAGDILSSPFVNPFLINITSISLGTSGYAVYGNTTSISSAFVPGDYTLASIDPLNQVTLSQDWLSGSIQIDLSGSVSITSSLGVSVSTCLWYLVPGLCFDFTNSFSLSTTLGITVTGATAFQAKVTLAEIPLGCIDVVIGCIIPNLEIDVGVQIQSQNSFSASVTYTSSESSSVYQTSCLACFPSWNVGYAYSQSSLTPTYSISPSVSIQAFADVPNLGFFFDYIAGPYVEVQPGLQFTTTFSASSITWNLALTLVLNIGVETAEWLGGTSLSVSEGPWSWTLASGAFSSYPVQFTESGLPGGATWTIEVDGVWLQSSTTTTLEIAFPTGKNTYTVSGYEVTYPTAIYTYTPSPASGSVSGATSVSITYTLHISVICSSRYAFCITT